MSAREGRPGNALIIMLAVLGGALVLCGALAVLGVGSSMYISVTEKDDVKVVLDLYMQRMAVRDAGGAYALFSSRTRRQLPASEIAKAPHGADYLLFDGYRSLEVDNMTVKQSVNTDLKVPQGTTASVDGKITYADGFNGAFQGLLEKEAGRWMLSNINIVVPPEKVSRSP